MAPSRRGGYAALGPAAAALLFSSAFIAYKLGGTVPSHGARLQSVVRGSAGVAPRGVPAATGALRSRRMRGCAPERGVQGIKTFAGAETSFPELKNDLLLRAARGEPTERVPVWIHRQAGRYLPEFMDIAMEHGYMKCFNTPELAAELTVQPIEKYGMDAAILFSDILVLLPVMGVEWTMTAGVEPYAVNAIETDEDVEKTMIDASTVDLKEKLGYVFESVTITRKKLKGKAPLIGFSGAPWTLLTYMMHGKGQNGRDNAREFIVKYPDSAKKILENASNLVSAYLIEKVAAGAQMLQVFDSWAGILSEEDFKTFSLPYLLRIAEEVKAGLKERGLPDVPMTVFPRGCKHSISLFSQSAYDCVALDEGVDPADARRELPGKTLQGNFEGKHIYDSEGKIREEVDAMLSRFGTQSYIANFGYAVEKDHDPDKIGVFVDEVRKESERMNQKSRGEGSVGASGDDGSVVGNVRQIAAAT
eukprot:CAMPEP_0197526120 /NCGR_PEP_ID=MMETSP1318-20131121/16408_1 /TAXON_ID=552666 /ORGANISM="Partenskyella glossopodia, Strain RCC365" /LENGTH=475 /DNA_ID=CAMNT_0043080129 /DNA_START=8 /DNA_END=1435 /DNA_ORIENTATION=+